MSGAAGFSAAPWALERSGAAPAAPAAAVTARKLRREYWTLIVCSFGDVVARRWLRHSGRAGLPAPDSPRCQEFPGRAPAAFGAHVDWRVPRVAYTMSVPPRLFARFVVALMCLVHVGLGIAANPGTHGRTTADGYLCGGHLAPAAIASLAGVVPDVFSEAYRQLTGSG